MNFVDEHDCACAVLPRSLGFGHDLLDFFYSSEYSREFNELGSSHASNDLRQCGFSRTRRSPKNHRAVVITFDLNAQRLARPNKVSLTNEFLECPGTHAIR